MLHVVKVVVEEVMLSSLHLSNALPLEKKPKTSTKLFYAKP